MRHCRLVRGLTFVAITSIGLMSPALAAAQPAADPARRPAARATDVEINGPPPPVPPAVVARDAEGRVTVRATRIAEPIVLDGRLDEPVYEEIASIGDFIQQEPMEGAPATERTEVWLMFDETNVYVSARLWDSQPERIVGNEMRRDNRNIFENDNFGVAFDTFYNQRTGFFFQTNPLGGLRDALVADEGQPNYDWDSVWDVGSGRFENGWVTEIAIPFKTLRFEGTGEQVWAVNFRRRILWKNETSYLAEVPASYGGRGITMFSLAAPLVGIDPPGGYRNLEFKPYASTDLVTNTQSTPPISNDLGGDLGVDVKYGLTRSLIADFTYNTDFAQVEADEQQINLTRFSLFFPEKREFFLEGQGIFEFGGVGGGGFGGGGNSPILFFSRRIGLEDGQTVPIRVGGRMTGRAGPYAIGLLNIQTEDSNLAGTPSTNFSVVRLRRDILRRSNVGVIMTRRAPSGLDGASNEAYGLDANMAFYQDVQLNGYYARSSTDTLTGDDESYRGEFSYGGDRYGARFLHLKVGDDFNPEIGFVRRQAFRENSGSLRFSPRPESIDAIRQFRFELAVDHVANLDGLLESREQQGTFGVNFESGDNASINYTRTYEFLPEPFEIDDGIVLPVGGYGFNDVEAQYTLGPHRRISGDLSLLSGTFYTGDRTEAAFNGRIELSPQLSLEPRIAVNWVDLAEGEFTSRLYGTRVTFTLSPRMFTGALIQYNSSADALTTNVRFRWEYQPGSDFFVVYSDGRDTRSRGLPGLLNRGVVVKFTRLFRM